MRDREEINKDHEAMRAERARDEPAWRDIARIIRPDDQEFNTNARVDRDDYEVFDSTPLYALETFSGGMFSENVNPAERWMELTIADKELAKWGPVQGWLWRRASRHYQSLAPSASNFYSEAPACFGNLGAFGNGFLYQEEWVGRQTIIDMTVPMGQTYIRLDAGGNLDAFDREFKYTGRQMKARWGNNQIGINCRDDQTYNLIHAVYRNPDYAPGRLGPRGMSYCSTYLSNDLRDFRIDKNYYEMPYHGFFWNKRPGRSYASGPGHNARADMNMNNEIARSNLVDAQFAAEPLILTTKEGIFTAADIQPNNILEGALNDQGKKLVDVLQRGDNSARAEHKQEQVKSAIREAFYFSMLQIKERPQMTATEYMGWKEERLRELGPNLTRVQQGLASFIGRRDRILDRAGQFADDPPPPELKGHTVVIEFVSPFAKAQKLATAKGVMQWVGSLGEIAKASGDPSVMDVVNKDGTARVLHDAMVGMPDVINDQRTVDGIRQSRAQFQQKQLDAETAAKAAGVVADVAHASQAMTLSSQRTSKAA